MQLMQLERNTDGFEIDASFLGELLNVPPSHVHDLMHKREITGVCERGEGEYEGQHRLTFFYKGRRARLNVDESGTIIRRSVIDLGDRPLAVKGNQSTRSDDEQEK
jgi:hypothetical protein